MSGHLEGLPRLDPAVRPTIARGLRRRGRLEPTRDRLVHALLLAGVLEQRARRDASDGRGDAR